MGYTYPMADPHVIPQPNLFDFSDSAAGVVELFPNVWIAMEELTSSNVEDRKAGLKRLISVNAHKLSPLVAYVLATCLTDPKIEFRYEIVQALGGLFFPDNSIETSDQVKQSLKFYLSQMRRRRVYALLQVADYHPSSETNVAVLLKACSHAGGTLSDIFLDRKIPVEIRRQAINFAGIVGFLDAVPALEKLAGRLEARISGQKSMPFAPPIDSNEKSLLPAVQSVLSILSFP